MPARRFNSERVSAAELKLTEDAIVSTVRGSEQYQKDQADLLAQIIQSDQIAVASAAPSTEVRFHRPAQWHS